MYTGGRWHDGAGLTRSGVEARPPKREMAREVMLDGLEEGAGVDEEREAGPIARRALAVVGEHVDHAADSERRDLCGSASVIALPAGPRRDGSV